jgi:hypothetical protein
MEMHGFLAREGREENQLDSVLSQYTAANGIDDKSSWHASSGFDRLLDEMEKGWLFLAAEAEISNSPIWKVSSAQCRSPDYRALFTDRQATVPTGEFFEQPYGLAPAILEAMTAHWGLLQSYLEEVDTETYSASMEASKQTSNIRGERKRLAAARDKALDRYGRAFRYGTVAESVARLFWERANQGGQEVGWSGRWMRAQSELLAAKSRAATKAASIALVKNPLGIEEDDVPLFFGDVTGTNSRFFASSDYLLNVWAAPAVAAVGSSLENARSAWISARNSYVQDDLLKNDKERRLDELKTRYGSQLAANCGLADDARLVLDLFDPANSSKQRLSPATCHIDYSKSGCGVTDGKSSTALTYLAGQLTEEQAKWQLCRWKLGGSYVFDGLEDTGASSFVTAVPMSALSSKVTQFLVKNGQSVTVSYGGMQFDATDFWKTTLPGQGQPDIRALLQDIEVQCNKNGVVPAPLPDWDIPNECLRGRMGAAAQVVRSAKQSLVGDNQRLYSARSAARDRWNYCSRLISDSQQLDDLANAVTEICDSWEYQASQYGTVVTNAVATGMANPAAGIASLALGSFGLMEDTREKEAERRYQYTRDSLSRSEGIAACLNEAHSLKLNADSAVSDMRARAEDAASKVTEFNNLAAENERLVKEGTAAVRREEGRPFGGYSFYYWYDEKVEKFKRDFAWAKRLTYLAMRAVEYEFQATTSLRDEILGARHPRQLELAIAHLQQEQAGRTINRRRPSETSVVLSLRDDILRLASRKGEAFGERDWTPAMRFMNRIGDPDLAIRNLDGDVLGQGIRFSLDPSAGGVLSGGALVNRCAERVWRVTATVQGDGLSAKDPNVAVFLLKRNTFESQWCSSKGDGSPMQSSSIQPSRDLFKAEAIGNLKDEDQNWTAALVYPWFNVRRSDFYKVSYQEGASEELAGRGLYGDYLLLFPKELTERGFPLGQVEDVLIRFDYLSVDNLANPMSSAQ